MLVLEIRLGIPDLQVCILHFTVNIASVFKQKQFWLASSIFPLELINNLVDYIAAMFVEESDVGRFIQLYWSNY